MSVGGNLRAIGTKPDGSQWTGGVENPWNASEVYTNTNSIFGSPINMSDLALVTSGDYQRYFVVDGKRYHHIIDRTPVARCLLQRRHRAVPGLRHGRLPDHCPVLYAAGRGTEAGGIAGRVEAMWCTPDKQATTSSGWDSHLKK